MKLVLSIVAALALLAAVIVFDTSTLETKQPTVEPARLVNVKPSKPGLKVTLHVTFGVYREVTEAESYDVYRVRVSNGYDRVKFDITEKYQKDDSDKMLDQAIRHLMTHHTITSAIITANTDIPFAVTMLTANRIATIAEIPLENCRVYREVPTPLLVPSAKTASQIKEETPLPGRF